MTINQSIVSERVYHDHSTQSNTILFLPLALYFPKVPCLFDYSVNIFTTFLYHDVHMSSSPTRLLSTVGSTLMMNTTRVVLLLLLKLPILFYSILFYSQILSNIYIGLLVGGAVCVTSVLNLDYCNIYHLFHMPHKNKRWWLLDLQYSKTITTDIRKSSVILEYWRVIVREY